LANERKQQPEKISADCPHCGFSQLESAFAKSTFCRKCGQHFSIEKLLAKEVASLKPPSIFEKLSKLISREKTREVSTQAESTSCPKCGSYMDLRDFKITGPFGRGIQTQGEVTITSKGDVTSQRILCGTARIEGKMRSHMICTGTVEMRLQGKLAGTVEAHRVVIEKKSEIELTKPLRVEGIEINGGVTGEVVCNGRVTINKHGVLSGIVRAKAITVEKGGIFAGELHIGEGEFAPAGQGDAAPAEAPQPSPASAESAAPPAVPAETLPQPAAPAPAESARRRPLTLQSARGEEKRSGTADRIRKRIEKAETPPPKPNPRKKGRQN
jgi:cytoskeletal protein CcmA (bactofilin family)